MLVFSDSFYYVGATLTYGLNGIKEVIDVAADTIFVKPMPKLTLDYFMPTDVYANDPLTAEIEPVIPFTLGVRVRIVENKQGLLINSAITDSFIDEQRVNNSLLLDFGEIVTYKKGLE